MNIEKEVRFNTSIEKTWNLLTNPDLTKQYMFGCEVLSKWRVGEPIIWKGLTEDGKEIVYVKGKIIEYTEGRKVSFTMFDPNLEIEDIPENYINLTYELLEKKSSTILKLTQGNFATVANGEQRHKESLKGWEMVIPLMKEVIKK